ncbi:ribonuclease H-like domain-containing protein [Tanacetum coccineum]
MSFDDLYNNFKIVKQEVKGTASSKSSSSSQNMTFVTSPSSTNEVNTAYEVSIANTQVSPASTQVSTASTQVSTANLSDATVYAFLANQPNMSQLVHEDLEQIHEDDLEEMDLKWQLALLSMRTRRFFQKTTRKITINESDTAGYEKFKVECFKCHKLGHFARECRGSRNQDSRNMNQDSSRRTINMEETSSKAMLAIDGAGLFSPPNLDLSNSGPEEFQQPKFKGYRPTTSKNVSEDISNEVRESLDAPLVEELVSNDKSQGPRGNQRKWNNLKSQRLGRNNYTRVNYNYSAQKAHPSAQRNMVPRAVLMKTGLRTLNTARPVNTAHPKTTVHSARPMPKAVNTARPNTRVVNVVRANHVNAVKASACWSHLPKKDQGYVDSGCSRHMTGNMSYLLDFKEFNGGYVTFGGGAKGGRIAGKDTLKTGNLDFEDVLLKVPRKNNMYSVDMKNIVPKESLTCLVANATLDELMLWHRRLGHVNFKTINKLFKDNLVRGLPTKRFKNDQTCVACLKGKQHKASCKSKIQNSTTQPLFMLHMDLFGPTFVSSLMKKKYCLVVTDDYRRFTWVFFLASKDETSGILKSFITEIENLVDKKNRVLVVKPHNKTLYELFRGRIPSLSFMRPFGCHVTILNTLDHLGKFDGKSDDGFFVRYSLNSDGPKWLFDIDVLTKSMNYVPVVADTNSNDFVGTKESIGAGQSSKETGSSQDYILMSLWKNGLQFDSSSKNASNDEPQPSNDTGKKDDLCGDKLQNEFCLTCNSGAGNSFFYDPNSYNDSQNFSDYPTYSQPILCEFFGNDACYGHYCTPQVSIISSPEPCYNQNYDEFPQTLPSFQQQILCRENCGGPHATFECQPMNQNFHDSNSFGYDQFQPPQFPVIHQPPKRMSMEALQAREDLMESIQNFLNKFNRISFRETPKILMRVWDKFIEVQHAQSEEVQELFNKLIQDVRNVNEELAEYIKLLSWNLPTSSYDDDDNEERSIPLKDIIIFGLPPCVAITPDSPKTDSLIMEDEHLDTIPETKLDEFIKSSVENLVQNLSESEDEYECEIDLLIEEFAGELTLIAPIPPGIVEADLDPKGDIRFIENLMYDNSFPCPPKLLNDDSKTFIDSNNDYSSSNDDSYEDIDYVDASPPDFELVSLEEVKIEALNTNPPPSSDFVTKSSSTSPNLFLEKTNTLDNSLTESETFCFNPEEISSGSTTTRSDVSLSDYEAFYFDDDHIEENSSGSTTTQSDISLSK